MHVFFSIPWIHEISMWFSLSDAYKGILKKSVLHYFASFPISCHPHHFTFLSWLLFLNIEVPHYHLLHLDPLTWPFILRTIPYHPWNPLPSHIVNRTCDIFILLCMNILFLSNTLAINETTCFCITEGISREWALQNGMTESKHKSVCGFLKYFHTSFPNDCTHLYPQQTYLSGLGVHSDGSAMGRQSYASLVLPLWFWSLLFSHFIES